MESELLKDASLLIVAFCLVLLNGFFVLSEFSIVKIRRSRLEELVKNGRKNAKLALKMSSELDSYLSATQLGITLSSLALGWIGEPAVARLLEDPFTKLFGANTVILHSVSFAVAFTFITLIHVVAGELIPKSIAIAKAESSTLFVARPLHLFHTLFYPLIKLFDTLAAFFLHRMDIRPASESGDTAHSEEELKYIAGESFKGGFIDSVEQEIIKNAVNFSDTMAKKIMTPRRDIICLKAENSYEENIKIIQNTGHTRYPYSKGGSDMVIGMIHIRDVLENELSDEPTTDFSLLVRELIVVPEMTSIADILAKMNSRQIHTALIIDEYGGTAGILTMEDIIEEIMGDISDEHDKKVPDYDKIDDNTYDFDAMTDLEDAEEALHVDYSDCDQVTLGGYVLNLLGKFPNVGDKIDDGFCSYEVLKTDRARIKKIRVVRLQKTEESE